MLKISWTEKKLEKWTVCSICHGFSEEAINDAAFNFEQIKTEQELFGDQDGGLETFK
jgi:hypothetical protein